ncbi:MAG TPA: Dabb family protein, partial [Pirellulales bacterium]|nr:Dabb family protein [Pirellulales bacterium]
SAEAIDKLVAACHQYLTDHPGTVYFSVGKLADLARPVNDRQFDVALHVVFENRQAHDAYQVAPRHKQFIAETQPNWANVRVFDSNLS